MKSQAGPSKALWPAPGCTSAVTRHACDPSEVFQEFGHILSRSHPEKELPVLQTKMHLYPCKISGAFNTKIIIPLSIVYCNRTLGARGLVGNLIHGTSLLHGWPHQRLTACNTASEASVLTFLTTLTVWPFLPEGGNQILKERTDTQRAVFWDSGKKDSTLYLLIKGLWLWTTIH